MYNCKDPVNAWARDRLLGAEHAFDGCALWYIAISCYDTVSISMQRSCTCIYHNAVTPYGSCFIANARNRGVWRKRSSYVA